MPSFQSIIPSLVNQDNVSRAVALNSIQFNISRILGPVLAGIMIASYGAAVCYGANLLSFFPFFISLYLIYPRGGFKKKTISQNEDLSSIKQFKNILINPQYQRPLITIFVSSLFCGPLLIFCPVLVKEIFHGGAKELGWAMTSFGVGGILGGIFSSLGIKKTTSRKFANITGALLGLILIAVGSSTSLLILDGFLLIAGMLLTLTNTASNSNLQRSIGEDIRGHIISLFQMALHSGLSIGSLIIGLASTQLGIQRTLEISGIIVITIQLFILTFSKKPNLI